MEIRELMMSRSILLGQRLETKEQVLDTLAGLAVSAGAVTDKAGFLQGLRSREEQASTDFGKGLAVPHAQGPFAVRPAVVAVTVPGGVPWGKKDGSRCDVFFCIAAPSAGGEYMHTLACLMTALRYPGLGKKLTAALEPEEFLAILEKAGQATDEECEAAARRPRILAVTACPTGIAHTYLAADALKEAAQALEVPIKVETNGSIGVQNELTKEDIQNCDAVIVAADKKVETARFAGKRVIFVPVSSGVYQAQQLIQRAMAGEAPVYHPGTDLLAGEILPAQGAPQGLYRHLMSGVAQMIPFVVAGGILTALGLMLDDYQIDPFNFGGNLPLAAFLTVVGEAAFSFMLPVAAGYIAHSIAGLPGLSVGFVAGALAARGVHFQDLSGGDSGGFLAAVLAGFLAGYVVRGLQSLTRGMPEAIAALKPTLIYPLVGTLLVGAVICLANPLLARLDLFLKETLAGMQGGSKVLLGAVLGGMMGLDLGGPVNKAAYVFATAALAGGGLEIMAAVMAGGMAPPLAMAMCTTLFPRHFNPAARRTGAVAWLLGFCFITEGAVPFAVADPFRVIPSCVVSGALAGSISMALGCTLAAPQGGIFVLPLMNRPFVYLLGLLVSALAGALLYAVLRGIAALRRNM